MRTIEKKLEILEGRTTKGEKDIRSNTKKTRTRTRNRETKDRRVGQRR